jgi:hypothetical protein
MPRILSFTKGPEDWKALLADPASHWKPRKSARTLAYCWEAADGFPPEIAEALARAKQPFLKNLTPLLAIPEFKVHLPGGKRPSQSDIFVIARSDAGPVSIVIEGKVDEPFGETVGDWLKDASEGKKARLKFLLETLGLPQVPDPACYQLLHRAASALLAGAQFRAVAGVMLVHSFTRKGAGWEDYEAFAGLFGTPAESGEVQELATRSDIPLYGAWVAGDCRYLES